MNENPNSIDESLDEAALERIDRVCLAFEQDWKQGVPPRLESYLSGFDGSERVALLYHLVCVDLVYRRQRGEK